MDIGDAVAVGKLQGGVALEERHHARRGVEKGIDHRGVEALAQFVFKIGARL